MLMQIDAVAAAALWRKKTTGLVLDKIFLKDCNRAGFAL